MTFGPPLLPAVVRAMMASASASGMAPAQWCDDGDDKDQSTVGMPVKMNAEAEVNVRISLTEVMQHALWKFSVDRYLGIHSSGLPRHHPP